MDKSAYKLQPDSPARKLGEAIRNWFEENHAIGKEGSGAPFLVRLEIPGDSLSLFDWLAVQEIPERIYWSDRNDDHCIAAVGAVDRFCGPELMAPETLMDLLSERLEVYPEGVRYFGGMAFDGERSLDDNWAPFGAFWFVVPRLEIHQTKGETRWIWHFWYDPNLSPEFQTEEQFAFLERLDFTPATPGQPFPETLDRTDAPDQEGWTEQINTALKLFESGQLDKLVLARKSRIRFSGELNPVQLLQRLRKNNTRAFHFCFQPRAGSAFIGGSPERLFSRCNGDITSEAVAGTRPRGKTPVLDQKLETELLDSEKDRWEHLLVVDQLKSAFRDFCDAVEMPKNTSVLKLSRLQHLYAGIRGKLKKEVNEGRLLTVLHPTPAVGGTPRKEALDWIDRLEPFARGWYAAPVGWISRNASEFAVAIRSGLVIGNVLNLFSGAGIVAGSLPGKEWEEIETKLVNFIRALDSGERVHSGLNRNRINP